MKNQRKSAKARGEYINPNDEKAFQTKKEVDDFKTELVKFWENM